MSNLRRKFKGKLNQKQDIPYTISGVLGNGFGVVEVIGRNNYVYVRLAGSGLAEVFNNRVVATNDLPVVCGYDPLSPSKFQVLSIQGSIAESSNFATGSVGYAPASRYRWMYPGGGQDPLFVELRQIMPLRIAPAGGTNIIVSHQIAWTGTTWELLGGSTLIPLESYIPTTADKCCMVLVCIDVNGDVTLTKGTEVNIADLVVGNIPDPPAQTKYILGAVRLYYGQTLIQEARTNTDIVDLRFPQGIGGEGGSLTIEEQDGSPSVSDVITIKVDNGVLTDEGGGVVSLNFSSLVPEQVQSEILLDDDDPRNQLLDDDGDLLYE